MIYCFNDVTSAMKQGSNDLKSKTKQQQDLNKLAKNYFAEEAPSGFEPHSW